MSLKGRQRMLPKPQEPYSVTIVFVRWIDSGMAHSEHGLHELPSPLEVYSSGILLAEDDNKITFAVDTWKYDDGEVMARQITSVPKVAIYEIKKFTA